MISTLFFFPVLPRVSILLCSQQGRAHCQQSIGSQEEEEAGLGAEWSPGWLHSFPEHSLKAVSTFKEIKQDVLDSRGTRWPFALVL